ncbi:hypothetical protein BFP70_03080 [Thioclava sp. SK-1]|uniref:hypothetical protein n=1 Tax=Thioclava sp. SK-1 TaxID=1889770 RepID=UPI0008242A9F|nr:hypothetical protein [Thioclava sp. SK-1]OCX67157.1 hypothetical protein BFP70_03080 [Thioclava sp. SK-1]
MQQPRSNILHPILLSVGVVGFGLLAPMASQAQTVLRGGAAMQSQKIESEITADTGLQECRDLRSGDRFCRTVSPSGQTGRWVLSNKATPDYAVGDAYPVYQQSMLMDLRRYDLPDVDGNWRYYMTDNIVYKVAADTNKVIEVVGYRSGR